MKLPVQYLGARTVVAAAALLTVAQMAWALEPFKVQDIRVEGLQRVEAGTVFASIPVRVGDEYDDEKGTAAIRALFALGLFKDVRLEANGDVLVVVVEERPTIANVEFVGTKEFDKKPYSNRCAMSVWPKAAHSIKPWPIGPSKSSSANTSAAACTVRKWWLPSPH